MTRLAAARSSDHRNRNEIDAFISRETCPYPGLGLGFQVYELFTARSQISGLSLVINGDERIKISRFEPIVTEKVWRWEI